ncbi:isopentenyl-diphosphate Delta-isomerase 1-like [Rhynchophorus ferrugineus]|uniref:isopentenyl-diphosphate Delta-isomerase n=1 Tax=Rhynchophorus ferrugineus TaxID=354439 RepID=A0A834IN58_RHYFE|nr:hypothetical protein GWI33_005484 [Rhynchophorus ferrugineus]
MDPTQEKYLQDEECILVDEFDIVMGSASKEQCHLIQNDGTIKLHRAFSVFLFNSKEELLFQKRSSQKVTYPNKYSNTCCSHPLANIEGEDEEFNALGIKRAVIRKLHHELGIQPHEISLDDIIYVTRIHYKDARDGKYGEHEIDYIIIIKKDVQLSLNLNEISEVRYVARDEIDEFLRETDGELTPWVEMLIRNGKLKYWWDNLDRIGDIVDDDKIIRFNIKSN